MGEDSIASTPSAVATQSAVVIQEVECSNKQMLKDQFRALSVPSVARKTRERSRPPLPKPKTLGSPRFGDRRPKTWFAPPRFGQELEALPPKSKTLPDVAIGLEDDKAAAAGEVVLCKEKREKSPDAALSNPFDDELSEASVDDKNPFAKEVAKQTEKEEAPAMLLGSSETCSSTTAGSQSTVSLSAGSGGRTVSLPAGTATARASSVPSMRGWPALPTVPSSSSMLRGFSPAAVGRGSMRRQSSASGDSAKGDLRMDVYRLTASYFGQGMRRHDRRSLRIWKGFLHIFGKGSTQVVKSTVDVATDLVNVATISPGVLSLCFTKGDEVEEDTPATPTPTSASELPAGPKMYFFEFDSPKEAEAFQAELKRIKEAV